VPAEALATVLICIQPGYVLPLALLGPGAVAGIPDAVRALWSPPAAETESRLPAPAAQ
jgi:TetR/AcrR family transcriptional regulator, transcriptional repressor of aconitase